MKVLVLGATGYIGLGVARAFRRAGHHVYGLMRDAGKSNLLASHEIFPIVGDVAKPETWRHIADRCSVIISCIPYDDVAFKAITQVLHEMSSGEDPRHFVFIHTSGIWIYGGWNHGGFDELSGPHPLPIAEVRGKFDEEVKNATKYMGVVIHPGMVYGYEMGGLIGPMIFKAAADGEVSMPGTGDTRWSMVHVDDLGDAYVAAAERYPISRGQDFIISNPTTESVRDIVHAVVHHVHPKAKINWIHPIPRNNVFFEALATSFEPSPRKAEAMLGWRPKHPGFVDEASVFTATWKMLHKKEHHH